jgi:hypothetical protein
MTFKLTFFKTFVNPTPSHILKSLPASSTNKATFAPKKYSSTNLIKLFFGEIYVSLKANSNGLTYVENMGCSTMEYFLQCPLFQARARQYQRSHARPEI